MTGETFYRIFAAMFGLTLTAILAYYGHKWSRR